MTESIHGDLGRRVAVDTRAVGWEPSPSPNVLRKRLHRVGPAETGQVTSVVRYRAGARFTAHDHPEGEEILVLEGVFSDEHGDRPAGTYLLNPEGFRHAPFSADGCRLFVKLRQYPGAGRHPVAVDTGALEWSRGPVPGVEVKALYAQPGFPETMDLEHWAPGTCRGATSHAGGIEFFVLEGSFSDEIGRYAAGGWLRLPAGATHRPQGAEGCVLYIKRGGHAHLRSAPRTPEESSCTRPSSSCP